MLRSHFEIESAKEDDRCGPGTGKTFIFRELLKERAGGTNLAMTFVRKLVGSAKPSLQPSSGREIWLERETKSEVVLVPRLHSALERSNPTLPADAIKLAINELARDRSAMSLRRRIGRFGISSETA